GSSAALLFEDVGSGDGTGRYHQTRKIASSSATATAAAMVPQPPRMPSPRPLAGDATGVGAAPVAGVGAVVGTASMGPAPATGRPPAALASTAGIPAPPWSWCGSQSIGANRRYPLLATVSLSGWPPAPRAGSKGLRLGVTAVATTPSAGNV